MWRRAVGWIYNDVSEECADLGKCLLQESQKFQISSGRIENSFCRLCFPLVNNTVRSQCFFFYSYMFHVEHLYILYKGPRNFTCHIQWPVCSRTGLLVPRHIVSIKSFWQRVIKVLAMWCAPRIYHWKYSVMISKFSFTDCTGVKNNAVSLVLVAYCVQPSRQNGYKITITLFYGWPRSEFNS